MIQAIAYSQQKIGINDFIMLGLIGSGEQGNVYAAQKIDTKQIFAMKIVNKKIKISTNRITYFN